MQPKREWVTPTVQRYGSFEQITRGEITVPCANKSFGFSDGVFLSGTPIGCAS
jgi:hypothetical protein